MIGVDYFKKLGQSVLERINAPEVALDARVSSQTKTTRWMCDSGSIYDVKRPHIDAIAAYTEFSPDDIHRAARLLTENFSIPQSSVFTLERYRDASPALVVYKREGNELQKLVDAGIQMFPDKPNAPGAETQAIKKRMQLKRMRLIGMNQISRTAAMLS